MHNATPFAALQPAPLWRHFEAITRIPRPSRHEEKMVAYVQAWAAGRGYAVARDATGNLCVAVPASPGREKAPAVVLQSHLDMVCERNADSPYDAEQGRIHAVREGDWIFADGTTLGADNGIGVAAMLSVAEAEEFPHGPLELLFTLDEETGLTGAKNLDPGLVRSRTLINLDSEDDGVLCVGCAGGTDTRFLVKAARTPIPAGWKGLRIDVTGLQGGHSGTDIDKNRLNAIRAMTRILQTVGKKMPLVLGDIRGGNKRNAIPRECNVIVCCPASAGHEIRQTVEQAREFIARQYRGLDDGLKVTVADHAGDAAPTAFSAEQTNRLLDLLRAIPTGVVAMSQDLRGLVETSSNLSVIGTNGDTIEIICSSRSSVVGGMRDILDTLHSLARLAGATLEEKDGYPGWKPIMSSRALAVTTQTYRNLFGSDPHVTAVHAGLECGIIGERIPGMDMVSFGPQINGPHAPGERVHVPSVAKFWELLGAVLNALSQ
jgi:dipeptidase D